jgi:hypothetical protein
MQFVLTQENLYFVLKYHFNTGKKARTFYIWSGFSHGCMFLGRTWLCKAKSIRGFEGSLCTISQRKWCNCFGDLSSWSHGHAVSTTYNYYFVHFCILVVEISFSIGKYQILAPFLPPLHKKDSWQMMCLPVLGDPCEKLSSFAGAYLKLSPTC